MPRGRPQKIKNGKECHITIPGDLADAIFSPGCSKSDTIRRACSYLIEKEKPGSLAALGIRIRELKRNVGRISHELQEARKQAIQLGVTDIDSFEEKFAFYNDE
jgi:hypothetical protein